MLDSIYHMTLKLLKQSGKSDHSEIEKSHFWRGKVKILLSFTQRYNGRHYVTLRG